MSPRTSFWPDGLSTVVVVPSDTYEFVSLAGSIGHPPHSSASPVELRLRVGPHALGEKKELREQRVSKKGKTDRNAPKENKLEVKHSLRVGWRNSRILKNY